MTFIDLFNSFSHAHIRTSKCFRTKDPVSARKDGNNRSGHQDLSHYRHGATWDDLSGQHWSQRRANSDNRRRACYDLMCLFLRSASPGGGNGRYETQKLCWDTQYGLIVPDSLHRNEISHSHHWIKLLRHDSWILPRNYRSRWAACGPVLWKSGPVLVQCWSQDWLSEKQYAPVGARLGYKALWLRWWRTVLARTGDWGGRSLRGTSASGIRRLNVKEILGSVTEGSGRRVSIATARPYSYCTKSPRV